MKQKILEINNYLKKHQWCDFSIINLNYILEIGGSTSFSEDPDIKITFTNVFFIQSLNEWRTDTSKDVFFIGDEQDENYCYGNYYIEEGYFLFKIIVEDGKMPIYIIAENIEYEI